MAQVHRRFIGLTDGQALVRLGDTLVSRRARVELTRCQSGNPGPSVDDCTGSHTGPDIVAEFEIQDGVPECTRILWEQKPGGRAVRVPDLRLITSLDGLAQNAFLRNPYAQRVDKPGWLWNHADADPARQDYWSASSDVESAVSARGRGPSRGELEDVARVYQQNADNAPTAAVESWFGYSRRTAIRRVQQAREAGLLPPVTDRKKA